MGFWHKHARVGLPVLFETCYRSMPCGSGYELSKVVNNGVVQ